MRLSARSRRTGASQDDRSSRFSRLARRSASSWDCGGSWRERREKCDRDVVPALPMDRGPMSGTTRSLGPGLAALLLLAARASRPEEPAAPGEEIVVTATRSPRPVRDVSAAVTVVPRAEIERSPAKTLDELLLLVPSFVLFL